MVGQVVEQVHGGHGSANLRVACHSPQTIVIGFMQFDIMDPSLACH